MRRIIVIGIFAAAITACSNTPSTQSGTQNATMPAANTPAAAPMPAVAANPLIDEVIPGDDANETKHNQKGDGDETGDWTERTYRHSVGGWFSWDLKVIPDQPTDLWVTYAGVDKRRFKVLVDDKLISDTAQPGSTEDFYDFKYVLPPEMTKGKQKVTVKFQADNDTGYAGGVFGVKTKRPEAAH